MKFTLQLDRPEVFVKCKDLAERVQAVNALVGNGRYLVGKGMSLHHDKILLLDKEGDFKLTPRELSWIGKKVGLQKKTLLFSLTPIFAVGATTLNDLESVRIARRDGTTVVHRSEVVFQEVEEHETFPSILDERKEAALERVMRDAPSHWQFKRANNGTDVIVKDPSIEEWGKTTLPYYFVEIGAQGILHELHNYFERGFRPMWWNLVRS